MTVLLSGLLMLILALALVEMLVVEILANQDFFANEFFSSPLDLVSSGVLE